MKSNKITLKNKKNTKQITVGFDNFPYLGIWSMEGGAPFVCIEPWYGVTSRKGSKVQLDKKEGILSLPSGKMFECSYTITID